MEVATQFLQEGASGDKLSKLLLDVLHAAGGAGGDAYSSDSLVKLQQLVSEVMCDKSFNIQKQCFW